MNRLFYGGNLTVLRESIADDSVDLIYLDPPFNSSTSCNEGRAGMLQTVTDLHSAAFPTTVWWSAILRLEAHEMARVQNRRR
jgi:16S rRNA G966 N2-methylase RsmD